MTTPATASAGLEAATSAGAPIFVRPYTATTATTGTDQHGGTAGGGAASPFRWLLAP